MHDKDPISVIDDVAGGQREEYRHEFERDGHLVHARLRNYVGHEFDVRYYARVEPVDGSAPVNVFRHLGREYITGNNDVYELDFRREVATGDELVVEVENADPDRLYHASAVFEVDYEHGLFERISALLGGT